MNGMYYSTGHILDFMSLRIQRAFVGFPDFKTEINFPIVFFETAGCFSFMMALIPAICEPEHEPEQAYKQVQGSPQEIDQTEVTIPIKILPEDEDKLISTLMRNYLMIIFYFEMVHNAFTLHLLRKFGEVFFFLSPTEFTFRFIDWYIFILSFLFGFIINKI